MIIYVFYLDIFLLHEVLMNSAIICITLRLNKLNVSKRQLFGAIFLGSIFPLMGLVWGYKAFILTNYLIVLPLIGLIVAGRSWRRIISCVVSLVGITFLLGGIAEAVKNTFKWGDEAQDNCEIVLLISAVLGAVAAGIFQEKARIKRYVFRIRLSQGCRIYRGYGLYDSGNCLRHPKTGQMVHIIDADVLAELGVDKVWDRIEYKSLGNSIGIIETYRIEDLEIIGKGIKYNEKNCLFGKAQEGLLSQKEYKIVLNEGIGNEIM